MAPDSVGGEAEAGLFLYAFFPSFSYTPLLTSAENPGILMFKK